MSVRASRSVGRAEDLQANVHLSSTQAMPTYEYRCPKGHHFELFQRMSDEPKADCPECGKVAERLLSGGAGLLFKGEGFYITDYRSDTYQKAAKAEGEKKGASDGGAGTGDAKGSKAKESPSSGSTGSSAPPKNAD